jgi:hypothetical protein
VDRGDVVAIVGVRGARRDHAEEQEQERTTMHRAAV